jgi:hypothetical protein
LRSKLSEYEKQLSGLGFWSLGIHITQDDATKHAQALPQIEETVRDLQHRLDEAAKSFAEKFGKDEDVEMAVDDDVKATSKNEELSKVQDNIARADELEKALENVKSSEYLEELAELIDEANEFIDREGDRQTSLKNQIGQFDEDLRGVCEEKSRLLSERGLESRLQNVQRETANIKRDVSKVIILTISCCNVEFIV